MRELKIAKEVAEQEFEEWCEANDIDTDTRAMSEEDEKDFRAIKNRIVKAISLGRASVNGRAMKYTISEYTAMPDDKREVEIAPPNGYAYTAMDGIKKGNDVAKMYAVMSQATGVAEGVFRKMDVVDVKFFQGIFQLFLA